MRPPLIVVAGVLLAGWAVATATATAAAAMEPQTPVLAANDEPVPERIVPLDWLVIEAVDNGGRRPFRPDHVFLRHLLDPASPPPSEGDEVTGENGAKNWTSVQAGDVGRVAGPVGWAYTTIESERDVVMLMDAPRARSVFVNGSGHVGDLYGLGYGPVPVAMRTGTNHIYVHCRRGSGFGLTLRVPESELVISTKDATVPDFILGQRMKVHERLWASITVANASTNTTGFLVVEGGGNRRVPSRKSRTDYRLVPLGMGKVAIPMHEPFAETMDRGQAVQVRLRIESLDHGLTSEAFVPVIARRVDETHKRTFISSIDKTVQEYAVVPPLENPDEWGWFGTYNDGKPIWPNRYKLMSLGTKPSHDRPGLVLTLHGAGVRSLNQARAYSRKRDLWIVAPTNRREYGFDWQDWGRKDAYEVLTSFGRLRGIIPSDRIYLTGHSMGGHGTWHLAANDPDMFAAIAPSAGWSSFDSYGSRPEGALRDLWHGADRASLTLDLIDNLKQVPTYVLHGDADDNVPPSEARLMLEALQAAGGNAGHHFEAHAGHWWDGQRAAGADCVDWPGIFELFEASRRPVPVDQTQLEFVTADPGVDGKHHWLVVEQPLRYGRSSRIAARPRLSEDGIVQDGRRDPASRDLVFDTENVRRFTILPDAPPATTWIIDGTRIPAQKGGNFLRASEDAPWVVVEEPVEADPEIDEAQKWPRLTGPFKRAFEDAFVLVYPTMGTAQENLASLERARYDSQVWWYRANGNARLVSDREFLDLPLQVMSHTLDWGTPILYGNADTNAAWKILLTESPPVDVRRGEIRIGAARFQGDDLGGVFVRAGRAGYRLVGAVASTGVAGDRVGYTLAYFVSGVGYPDYTAYSSRVLSEGDGGVLAAGWFDHAWELDGHGFVAADAPESSESR